MSRPPRINEGQGANLCGFVNQTKQQRTQKRAMEKHIPRLAPNAQLFAPNHLNWRLSKMLGSPF